MVLGFSSMFFNLVLPHNSQPHIFLFVVRGLSWREGWKVAPFPRWRHGRLIDSMRAPVGCLGFEIKGSPERFRIQRKEVKFARNVATFCLEKVDTVRQLKK